MYDIDYMIAVMQAFKEGKAVQAAVKQRPDIDVSWIDASEPSWNWTSFDYRVKPAVDNLADGLRHEVVEVLRDVWKLGRHDRFFDSAPLVERIVNAALAQQPAADEEAAEQFRKGFEAGRAAAQQAAEEQAMKAMNKRMGVLRRSWANSWRW